MCILGSALEAVLFSLSFFQFEDVARCQKQRDDLDICTMVELENLATFILVVMYMAIETFVMKGS